MCRFIESIKVKDGIFYRLNYHQERVNHAFAECMPAEEPFLLIDVLHQYIIPQFGVFKCRIVYDYDVQVLEFIPYEKRVINALKLIETEIQSHAFKPEDRTLLNTAFAQRAECDDVLLVRKGLLTDSSYSNIALFDGKEWHTPINPLIFGTNRAELLKLEKIIAKDIHVDNLKNYRKICLFNAMIEFGDIVLDISNINL